MSEQSRVTSQCDVAHSGRENLHHFIDVLMRGMLPLFSIMTLWYYCTTLVLENGTTRVHYILAAWYKYCRSNSNLRLNTIHSLHVNKLAKKNPGDNFPKNDFIYASVLKLNMYTSRPVHVI